jgi:hypothetical protein
LHEFGGDAVCETGVSGESGSVLDLATGLPGLGASGSGWVGDAHWAVRVS